jgi:integrase
MISDSEAGNRLSDSGDQIRPNTIKKYRVALRHLEAFEKRYSKVRIDDVNKDLAEKLQIYFNSINLAQNTKATQFNVYRTVINYAIDKKIIASTTFKEVTAPEILTDAIALSQEEVDKIAALHIDDELIRQHRDIFILGIYTMLRFSDYSHIDSVSIDKAEGIMSVITEKGQRPVVLPLHPSVLAILERYNDKLPQLKHVQIFNRSLKEIGRLAEIDKKTEIRTFKGGKVSKKIVERYSLISSHTARRTGATLLYLAGVPKKQIMLLTDHRKEANFDKYVRIDKLANAKMLSSHDFYADKQKKGL